MSEWLATLAPGLSKGDWSSRKRRFLARPVHFCASLFNGWILQPFLHVVLWIFSGLDPQRRLEVFFLRFFVLAISGALLFGTPHIINLLAWAPAAFDTAPEAFSNCFFNSGTQTCESLSKTLEIVRNFFLTLAGVIGALFGLFQLHNSAKRTRISEDEAAVRFEQERNERFVSISELLSSENPVDQLAGLVAMRKLGLEKNSGYGSQATKVIAGFIRMKRNYRKG